MEDKEVLVKVEGLGKKFCKNLKKSLAYGAQDVARSLVGKSSKKELRKGEFWALKDINFELRRGECLGLLGHNGAGKSTLLKVLNGLIKPDEGTVTIRGRVGALIELGAGFNPVLTGRENIYNNAAVLGFSQKEIDDKLEDIIDFSEIREFIDSPVQSYSSGMKVRLGFAVASQMEPDVLFIDEVLAVGDVAFRLKCFNKILGLLSNGVSIIFVSHSIPQVLRICTKGLVLNKGRVELNDEIKNAVTTYEKLFITDKLSKLGKDEKSKSKDVAIKKITLDRKEYNRGDNVEIKIHCSSNTLLKRTKIRIAVESPNLGPLGGFSSPYHNQFFDVDGEMEIIGVIENIPLQMGAYNIVVGWYSEDMTTIYDLKNYGVTLEITGPPIVMMANGVDGIINFKHSWVV